MSKTLTEGTFQKIVSSLRHFVNDRGENIRDRGQQGFGFLEVTDKNSPSLRPTRLSSLLHNIPQLGEGLNLCSRIGRGITHFEDFVSLFLGITLLLQRLLKLFPLFGTFFGRQSELLKSLGKDLRRKPALTEGVSKRALLLDHIVDGHTMNTRSLLQRILEDFATHTRVNYGVPVHQFDCARGKCLGKLIHGRTSLLGSRARHGCQVSDTLDGIHGSIEIDASRGKCTDITSHLCKVVNRHIGVFIQLIQSSIDIVKRTTLTRRIGKNGLYSIDLGFVFLETSFDGVDGQCRNNSLTCINRGIGDVCEGGHSHDLQSGEFSRHCFYRTTKTIQIDLSGGGIDTFKTLSSPTDIQFLLELVERRHASRNVSFEMSIIELHLYDSLVYNLAHSLATSLHASFAI